MNVSDAIQVLCANSRQSAKSDHDRVLMYQASAILAGQLLKPSALTEAEVAQLEQLFQSCTRMAGRIQAVQAGELDFDQLLTQP